MSMNELICIFFVAMIIIMFIIYVLTNSAVDTIKAMKESVLEKAGLTAVACITHYSLWKLLLPGISLSYVVENVMGQLFTCDLKYTGDSRVIITNLTPVSKVPTGIFS